MIYSLIMSTLDLVVVGKLTQSALSILALQGVDTHCRNRGYRLTDTPVSRRFGRALIGLIARASIRGQLA